MEDKLYHQIRATYASYMLWMYHRESEGSWEDDRFESWLEGLMEEIGFDLSGFGNGNRKDLKTMLVESSKAIKDMEAPGNDLKSIT